MNELAPLTDASLPLGIRSRFVRGVNGLRMHILEAGLENRRRPCVLLLHGFPELAFSWRKVMLPLASAGFYVIAPDQRGYGRTTGWDGDYDGDLRSFRLLNIVRDALGLVSALGFRSVAAVVGHDFGSPVAAWCALVRPDIFRSVVLMSAPFAGPPALPFDTTSDRPNSDREETLSHISLQEALGSLNPPRKHYQWYYSTRQANADMHDCPQGVHAFLRAYYHYKSADWSENKPVPLKSFTAGEVAKMPTYYIMELNKGMAATVAPEMPSPVEIASCKWLTESELKSTAPSMSGLAFRAASTGIVVGRKASITPNSNYFPVGRSTCLRFLSQESTIGVSIKSLAASSVCRPALARECWDVSWLTVRDTGCNRSSRKRCANC